MKIFSRSLILVAVCFLLVRGASTRVHGAAASHDEKELLPATEHQLAQARKATARYHDVEEAEADGYVNIHFRHPDLTGLFRGVDEIRMSQKMVAAVANGW